MNFNGNLVADIVYYIILYSALLCTVLPVIYVSLWKFLGFWRKRMFLYYFFCLLVIGVTFAAFYTTCNDWLLRYFAFPQFVQIVGLLLFVFSFIVIRISHYHLDLKTVLFYSALSQKHNNLRTSGIYRIVRHPIYSMVPLIILGAFLYTGEFVLVIPFASNLLLRWYYARLEEKYLLSTYGESYGKYLKSTPTRFYPALIRVK